MEKINKLSRQSDQKVDIEKIKISKKKDMEVVRIVKEIKKTRVKVLRGDKQQVEEDLVLKKRKMYIPKNEELRVEIIQLYYDILVVEHEERQETMELVIRNYWWPGIIKDIGKYMDGCDVLEDEELDRGISEKVNDK